MRKKTLLEIMIDRTFLITVIQLLIFILSVISVTKII
jgi:hypothetical protein